MNWYFPMRIDTFQCELMLQKWGQLKWGGEGVPLVGWLKAQSGPGVALIGMVNCAGGSWWRRENTQIHKYTNTQIHIYTNTQIQIRTYKYKYKQRGGSEVKFWHWAEPKKILRKRPYLWNRLTYTASTPLKSKLLACPTRKTPQGVSNMPWEHRRAWGASFRV